MGDVLFLFWFKNFCSEITELNSNLSVIDNFHRVSNYTTSFTVQGKYDFIIIYCRENPTITRSSGKSVLLLFVDDDDYAICIAKDVSANEVFTSNWGWIQYAYPIYYYISEYG